MFIIKMTKVLLIIATNYYIWRLNGYDLKVLWIEIEVVIFEVLKLELPNLEENRSSKTKLRSSKI